MKTLRALITTYLLLIIVSAGSANVISLFQKSNTQKIRQFTIDSDGTLREQTAQITQEALQTINNQAINDRILLELFDYPADTIIIDKVFNYIPGTTTIRGRAPRNELSVFLLTLTGNQVTGIYQKPQQNQEFRFTSEKQRGLCSIKEMDPSKTDFLEGGPSIIPPEMTEVEKNPQRDQSGYKDKINDTPTTIDVLIAYTPAARNYADNNVNGINNLISQSMALSQTALDNSGIDIVLNLVYSDETNYTESGNSHVDLYRLAYHEDFYPLNHSDYTDYLEEVPEWRDTYGADLVSLVTLCEDVGGVGYLLSTETGSPNYGYSIARAQQIAWGYTMVHEMGHNMGAHHRKDQSTQPGPGLYSFAAGWRWVGEQSYRYCSVMSYQELWDDLPVSRVGYFSNPDISHQGAPTGDETDADNALCLNNIRHVIASYRDQYTPGIPKIAGYITNVSGEAVAGVRLNFSDNSFVYSNQQGYYVKAVADGWSGTVTPQKNDYQFEPSQLEFNNVENFTEDNDFTATRDSDLFKVLSPNGGESWKNGEQHIITWSPGPGDDRAYITITNGNDINESLKDIGTRNDGDFTWDIPIDFPPGENYKILIHCTPSGLDDYSDDFFTIRERIIPDPPTLLSPANGGPVMGTMPFLDWSSVGLSAYKLQVATDAQFTEPVIDESYLVASHYSTPAWVLEANTIYYWRAASVLDGENSQWSDISTFQTSEQDPDQPYINTLSRSAKVVFNKEKEFYYPDRDYFITIIPSEMDSLLWICPPNEDKNNDRASYLTFDLLKPAILYIAYDSRALSLPHWMDDFTESGPKLYVSDKFEYFDVYEKHVAPGTITLGGNMANGAEGAKTQYIALLKPDTPATLTLLSPNGGEEWFKDTTHDITWEHTGDIGNSVKLDLYKNNAPILTLATGVDTTGPWEWDIPNNLYTGNDYQLKITSQSDTSIHDKSDTFFTIANAPQLTLVSPNGGENWLKGETRPISWAFFGNVGNSVKIELYNSGVFVRTLAPATENSGVWQWSITDDIISGSQYRVRIVSVTDTSVYDASNNDFTIGDQPQITVTSPNGGENWLIGSTHNITWTTKGQTGANVKIDLLEENHVVRTLISLTGNSGSWTWNVPEEIATGTLYRVKITSLADTSVNDISNNKFTIDSRPFIAVTAPNGGETWLKDSTFTITWQKHGETGDSVAIDLLKNGTHLHILTPGIPNSGAWNWAPWPDLQNAEDYAIRVTSLDYPAICDTSDSVFALDDKPQIIVTSPNGDETWQLGSTYDITWDVLGNPGELVQVRLMGAGKNLLLAENLENTGLFTWTIPTDITTDTNYKVRVLTQTPIPIWDETDGYFSIVDRPVLTLTAPNGGEEWLKGSTYSITWQFTGDTGDSVKLLLMQDHYLTSTISASTPNNSIYFWTIPETIPFHVAYRVYIISTLNPTIMDSSNAVFSIRSPIPGAVTLLTPPNNGATSNQYPRFTWSEPEHALDYHFQLGSENTFASPLVDTVLTGSEFTLPAPLGNGSWYWHVQARNESGASEWSEAFKMTISATGILAQNSGNIPKAYYLSQNYPNPFNPVTRIDFGLPKAGHVKVRVFNVSGQMIKELVSKNIPAGSYSVTWNAEQHPSGIYYVSITADDFQDLKKMVLVK